MKSVQRLLAVAVLIAATCAPAAAAESHFGLMINPLPGNEDWTQPDKTAEFVRLLGVKFAKSQISWRSIEKAKGVYDQEGWRVYDDLAKRLSAEGVQIVCFIVQTPPWAIDPRLTPETWPGKLFAPPAKNPADVASFFAQVVKRYKKTISTWALYQAVQNKNRWTEPQVLAEMYRLAREVLKKEQPQGRLVLSALEGTSAGKAGAYLEAFLKAGGGKYVDMYDFPQGVALDPFSAIEANTVEVKAILKRYGEEKKPVIYGALGIASDVHYPPRTAKRLMRRRGWKPIDCVDMTPELQARRLVAAMVLGRSLGVDKVFWGRTRDHGLAAGPAHDEYIRRLRKAKKNFVAQMELERSHGLIAYDQKPKPAFDAFRVLIRKLDRADVVRNLDVGKDAKGVLFREGDRYCAVFFTFEKETAAKLRCSAKELRVADMYDKTSTKLTPKDGVVALSFGPQPIYVEGKLDDLGLAAAGGAKKSER